MCTIRNNKYVKILKISLSVVTVAVLYLEPGCKHFSHIAPNLEFKWWHPQVLTPDYFCKDRFITSWRTLLNSIKISLADLRGGAPGTRAPSLGVPILSFSCSFQEKIGKIIGWHSKVVGAPPPVWEILDPPLSICTHWYWCLFLSFQQPSHQHRTQVCSVQFGFNASNNNVTASPWLSEFA